MSFRLKDAVFKVRCREPGCPFNSDFSVKENIMGATEADVDSEAMKIARNMGFIKHDALYGRKHQLVNPEVYKVDARYERIGTTPYATQSAPPRSASSRTRGRRSRRGPTARGEVIIRRGESAATVCEVIRGVAVNEKLPDLAYKAGSTFGAASIFKQKKRMVDIVAGEDGTIIAFYDLRELSKIKPGKGPRALRRVHGRRLPHSELPGGVRSVPGKAGKQAGSGKKSLRQRQPRSRGEEGPRRRRRFPPKKAARKTVARAAKKTVSRQSAEALRRLSVSFSGPHA